MRLNLLATVIDSIEDDFKTELDFAKFKKELFKAFKDEKVSLTPEK